MGLLKEWRDYAYSLDDRTPEGKQFWLNYFGVEQGIYKQLLSNPDEVVTGTVKELAEKYDTTIQLMTGFLDGIDESLKTPNNIEEMDENTEVSLDFDKELLYKNMVAAGVADEMLVQVSYAIGVAKPVSIYVNTYGRVVGTFPMWYDIDM